VSKIINYKQLIFRKKQALDQDLDRFKIKINFSAKIKVLETLILLEINQVLVV
jgi:hypothetical protein